MPVSDAMVEAAARVLVERTIRIRRKWDTDAAKLEEMMPRAVDMHWHDEADDARAALEAALSLPQGAPEWQPIDENTPKTEGERVLLGWKWPGYHVQIGFWSGDYNGLNAWCDGATENDYVPQPTHWKPLDTLPASPDPEGL